MSETKRTAATIEPLTEEQTYTIDRMVFSVQPVFKQEGNATLGTVLLRLMQNEVEHQ